MRRIIRASLVFPIALLLLQGVSNSYAEPRQSRGEGHSQSAQTRSLVPLPRSEFKGPDLRAGERKAVARAEEDFGGRAIGVAAVEGGYKVRMLLSGGRLVTVFIED